jgi:putative oxygen-independent coproporphyrinogen III oxidase
MAGIYVHIPFCEKRCSYCDFFSSISLEQKNIYIQAICKELALQKDYLDGAPVTSIYMGGGTPSLLSATDLNTIQNQIKALFPCDKLLEVTIEANPDDLTKEYIESLKYLPFNRISIGIQSFSDEELRLLNRRHTARQAILAVENCQSAGFNNISIDLIYGIPGQTVSTWKENLFQATRLNVQHISAYHLTYEPGTQLDSLLNKGVIAPVEEELSREMFFEMKRILAKSGFQQYEISNFCQKGYESRHNSAYWNGSPYLGIGPSAHSYNGKSRQWNIASLKEYISSIQENKLSYEIELIDKKTAYNEYILTRLRTNKGMDPEEIKKLFPPETASYCLLKVQKYIDNDLIKRQHRRLILSEEGLFVSDGIMSDLML